MAAANDTFFTTVGCMDGRCQEAVSQFGRKKFGAQYPDTITEAGLVGTLAHNPSEDFLKRLKDKLAISLEKHHSKGIVIDGHTQCAGNPVADDVHKDDVRKSVGVIQSLVGSSVPVLGVFVKQANGRWTAEELP